jgi:hypothetical protein
MKAQLEDKTPIYGDFGGCAPTRQKAQELTNALLELNAQISVVKGIRCDHERLWASIKKVEDEFRHDNSELFETHESVNKDLKNQEERLRELTLAAYALDPANKKPAPGVGIRITKRCEYDPIKAYWWAKTKEICLQLDTAKYEKALLSRIYDDIPGEVKDIVQPTISKNLEGDA